MNILHDIFLLCREPWRKEAACRNADPDLFILDQGITAARAIPYCARCTVRPDCEAYARKMGCVGVWGGKLFSIRFTEPIQLLPSPIQNVQDARPRPVYQPLNGRPAILGSPIQIGRPSILGR